jgi:hypothetical protein
MLGGFSFSYTHLAPTACCGADGFPLKKAQQYAVLRKPYLVNDVMAQDTLLDRRRVYRTLMVCAPTGFALLPGTAYCLLCALLGLKCKAVLENMSKGQSRVCGG